MLQSLLESWDTLIRPENADITFLIVENDSEAHMKPVVDRAIEDWAGPSLHYVLETQLGIPFGRNRAIDFVLSTNHDLLLFVDDDETVEPLWLVQMVAAFRDSRALLIGGPVVADPPQADLTGLSRIMFNGIYRRYVTKAQRARDGLACGNVQRTTIITNNWLGHRDLFTKHNLRFDEAMYVSGGSDAKFDEDARRAGVRKSWAPFAYVRELIPQSRISFYYQFERARDQSIVSFSRKLSRSKSSALIGLAFIAPIRLAAIGLLIILLPFSRGGSLVEIARASGWLTGRLSAALGQESRLYNSITGG